MIIIATGWGFLVPVLGVLFPFLLRIGVNRLMNDPDYYSNHPYLFYAALFAAAAICFVIGQNANRKFAQRNPENPDAGWGQKAFRAARKHTLFFIPMEYWAFIIPIVGYLVKQQFGIY